MVRYLKLKQNLNGFVPGGKKSFWDAVGPDKRVRPYFNIYGSLSGRSQPGSTSFLFLKPAWMRSLCMPEKGKAIVSIDYGSEEYLISALVSGDYAMVEAYESGDVYLDFAKRAGLAPKNATKQTHKKERDMAKPIVLSMSYLQTAKGLASKLSNDLNREVTEEEAKDYIDAFYEAYPDLKKWQADIQKQYLKEKHLRLKCGWTLWGDSDNFRSYVNFNIQGLGGSIMRKAVEFADEAGLKVILTLHDAIFIEIDSDDYGAIDTLRDCMLRGFIHYFDDKKSASTIKMDPHVWSPDYPEEDGEIVTPKGWKVFRSQRYIDDRSVSEYESFKKYFENRPESSL